MRLCRLSVDLRKSNFEPNQNRFQFRNPRALCVLSLEEKSFCKKSQMFSRHIAHRKGNNKLRNGLQFRFSKRLSLGFSNFRSKNLSSRWFLSHGPFRVTRGPILQDLIDFGRAIWHPTSISFHFPCFLLLA